MNKTEQNMLWDNQTHLMIDIETLGREQSTAVVQLSAVKFNQYGQVFEEFSEYLDIEKQVNNYRRTISKGTLSFWLEQNKDSQELLSQNLKNNALPTAAVLHAFKTFFNDSTNPVTYVWGNGSSFDLGILKSLHEDFDKKVPWDFWNERDVRTIDALVPQFKQDCIYFETTKNSVKHNGVDDCKNQIKYITDALIHINKKLNV